MAEAPSAFTVELCNEQRTRWTGTGRPIIMRIAANAPCR